MKNLIPTICGHPNCLSSPQKSPNCIRGQKSSTGSNFSVSMDRQNERQTHRQRESRTDNKDLLTGGVEVKNYERELKLSAYNVMLKLARPNVFMTESYQFNITTAIQHICWLHITAL